MKMSALEMVIQRSRLVMVKEGEGDMFTDEYWMVVRTIKWCSTDEGQFDKPTRGSETVEKAPDSDHLS